LRYRFSHSIPFVAVTSYMVGKMCQHETLIKIILLFLVDHPFLESLSYFSNLPVGHSGRCCILSYADLYKERIPYVCALHLLCQCSRHDGSEGVRTAGECNRGSERVASVVFAERLRVWRDG